MDPIFKDAIDILNREFPIFTGRVLDIGPPVLDASIPTACIATNKEDRSFTFRFNPDFAKGMTAEERAFVMAHEALHVLRNDPATMLSGEYEDIGTLNQAMDCIINDSLVNAGLGSMPEGGCAGPAMLGRDCSKLGVREVYDALVAKKQEQEDAKAAGDDGEPSTGAGDDGEPSTGAGDDGEPGDPAAGDDGEPSTGAAGDDGDDTMPSGSATGDHGWDEDTAAAASKHSRPDEDDDDTAAHLNGGTWVYAERHPIEVDDVDRLDLHAMLNELDPDIVLEHGLGPKQRTDWRMPARRFAGLAQRGVFIPAKRDWKDAREMTTKKYQIVVGCDISGSVDEASLNVFAKLISALPTDYAEFIFVAVATGALELDAEARKAVMNGEPVRDAVNAQGKRMNATQPYWVIGSGDGAHYWASQPDTGGLAGLPDTMFVPKRLAVRDGSLKWAVEAEALHCWIEEAVQRGRLEKYPRSVLFISDMNTFLTLSTLEQAKRWLCVYNHSGKVPHSGMDVTRPQGRRWGAIRFRANTSGNLKHGHCKLAVRQIRALSEWLR